MTELKRRKGIYLLPNLLTTCALFAGFYAIISSISGRYVSAAIAVIVAGFLDGIDGRVARLTNTQSDFGVQYDSLSDLISFGLAPAIIIYTWGLKPLEEVAAIWAKLGGLAAFLYTACAALRLARFNTQAGGVADKKFFQGLASPAAAGTLVSYVWVCEDMLIEVNSIGIITWVLIMMVALLMVSNIRYLSFKQWAGKSKLAFFQAFLLILVIGLLTIDTPKVLFVIGITYLLSGPIITLYGKAKHRKQRNSSL